MEAILVFDYNNYLIYHKHNKLFLGKITNIAKANKLVNNYGESKSQIICSLQRNIDEFNNLIVLIFGPYVASIRILREKCPKIDLFENEKIQVITRISGNDKLLNEMNRKLDIFISLAKLFYGVSINELENEGNSDVRNYLEFNLSCWEQFKDTALFMLNAQERLIVNDQIKAELNQMLINMIEKINEEPLLKEIPFQSMIFVNDQLICNYKKSNSPKILHSDLILLVLISKTYFQCLSDLDEKKIISSDSDYIASDDEYDICEHTICDMNTVNIQNSNGKNLTDYDYCLRLNNELNSTNRSKAIISKLGECDRFLFDDCEHQLIFLHSYVDRTNLVPFLIRFMRINDEIIFLVLSELPSTFLYYYANKILNFFYGLQYSNPKYYGFSSLNQFGNSIRKMQICLDYIISDYEKQNKKQNSQNAKSLKQKLDKFDKSDYRKYVLAHKNFQLSSQLEALTSSICLQLKELINVMIFTHHHFKLNIFRPITIKKLSKLKRLYFYRLRDYLEFISIKSKLNISIEPYCNLISNLILFIYVDRNRNEFVWSLDKKFSTDNCLLNNRESIFNYKSLICNFINKSYHLLKTTQSMQNKWFEKNLIFNYAIWFEDQTGKLLNCNDRKFTLKSDSKINDIIEEIVSQCFSEYKMVTGTGLNESLISTSSSSSIYSILKCYEIFYIQIKNPNQKLYCSDKVLNEERFQVSKNFLSSLELMQARRLGKKISSTNSL